MEYTTSLKFPNLFAVSKNQIVIAEGDASVVNRTKLLMLTEPTELYNSPDFGVGLRRHMFKYNNDIEKQQIRDRTVAQLRIHEPCVEPDSAQWETGLLFTGDNDTLNPAADVNHLKMTLSVNTIYGDIVDIDIEQ